MLRSAHILQLAVAALLGLGLVMVHSASITIGQEAGTDPLGALMGRNAIYALLALAAMLLTSRINVNELFRARGLANPLWLIVLLSLTLVALTLVPGIGRAANGASRWLYLGPRSWGLSFQPSELVKWVMVLAIAWWCARRSGVMHRVMHGLAPPLLLLALACGLILIEDWGTAVLVAGVGGCLLLAGGARWWHLLGLALPGALGFALAVWHSPYRLRRLTAFMDPGADPAGAGYHPIQSMLAIAQGELTGRGFGNGIQKFGYLPEDTTDFIFAIICEELGLAGAALVAMLYLVILWVGLGVVRDCRGTFGRLVALGVLLTLGVQAAINIAVVTVMVPTKGIALPLISAGGTGWILTAAAVGLVAALDNAHHYEAGDELDDLVPAEVDEDEDNAPALLRW